MVRGGGVGGGGGGEDEEDRLIKCLFLLPASA